MSNKECSMIIMSSTITIASTAAYNMLNAYLGAKTMNALVKDNNNDFENTAAYIYPCLYGGLALGVPVSISLIKGYNILLHPVVNVLSFTIASMVGCAILIGKNDNPDPLNIMLAAYFGATESYLALAILVAIFRVCIDKTEALFIHLSRTNDEHSSCHYDLITNNTDSLELTTNLQPETPTALS